MQASGEDAAEFGTSQRNIKHGLRQSFPTTERPPSFCLQAILLYTEGVLIAQYVFLIPTRLECDFLTDSVKVFLLSQLLDRCNVIWLWIRSKLMLLVDNHLDASQCNTVEALTSLLLSAVHLYPSGMTAFWCSFCVYSMRLKLAYSCEHSSMISMVTQAQYAVLSCAEINSVAICIHCMLCVPSQASCVQVWCLV